MFVIVSFVTSLSSYGSDNTDILIPIQFYWNNRTHLHHLTSHSMLCCSTA